MSTPLSLLPRSEHEARISKACPIIHPTGCTLQFCQSGRMSRPLEAQIGENRPIHVMKAEAEAFLHEMYDEGLLGSEADFQLRLGEVLAEIDKGVIDTKVWIDSEENQNGVVELRRVQVDGQSSSGWVQMKQELEWGVRVAWRNSRKCIMRAHYQDLVLIDLRHVTTSQGMIDTMMERLSEGYNGGRIQPTVFMFPPRSVDQMGSMFWNPQMLTFAGYELSNGKILGDPASVQITKDIIDLGWTPPEPKSRWDTLPIVAMAEGDEPVWGILPPEVTEPVSIRHPLYGAAFDALDLKWCRFPALSKLGFDIGGVQYTASPFNGWFMDAEIAVRNLADTFRYNVLPDVVKAIGWKSHLEFEDLADHEKLLWMSRAQAELNYAVSQSFMDAGISCTSSLTASESWIAFDDQHLQDKGYRLNADPYWIAPPQGSIIPLWHRGAAPNYQPKPLIAKHRYDPVKIWKKKTVSVAVPVKPARSETSEITLVDTLPDLNTRVHILWSGTGGTTLKIAQRLRKCIQNREARTVVCHFGSLNTASTTQFQPDDVVLMVISTTGQGQLPLNGQQFIEKMQSLKNSKVIPFRYAIFGLGDGGYHATFNAGANMIGDFLDGIGAAPLTLPGVLKSDVAIENPPFSAFKSWWDSIEGLMDISLDVADPVELEDNKYLQELAMIDSCQKTSVEFNKEDHTQGRILKLTVGISEYQEMGHIRLLPQNSNEMVAKALALLGFHDESFECFIQLPLPTGPKNVGFREFLTEYVDLQEPFRTYDWVSACPFLSSSIRNDINALQTLEQLFGSDHFHAITIEEISEILLSMTPFRPRCYSIASSASNPAVEASTADILLHVLPNGRFSSETLSSLSLGSEVRCKLNDSPLTASLLYTTAPIIAIACGTGFGPVRSLIQLRIAQSLARAREFSSSPQTPAIGKLTLFLGYKPQDSEIFTSVIEEAEKYGVLDEVFLVPSNEEKKRVQDLFKGEGDMLVKRLGGEGASVYVCGSGEMVKDVKGKMEEVVGEGVWTEIVEGGRVIEEVF